MACTYNVNGKEYTENEIQQVFASILTDPNTRDLSDEEKLNVIREITADRFVNINLFDPLQEQAITNIVFSAVITEIGVLKANEKSTKSAPKVFAEIRALFKNSSIRLNTLKNAIDGEEQYKELALQAQDNPELSKKFPELVSLTYDKFLKSVELMDAVSDEVTFNKFSELAKLKLKKLGLTIRNEKFEDYGLTDQYYQDLIQDEDYEDDTFTAEDRDINETFEDGRVFQMNPKDTASTRVKLFFSTVPSPNKNVFGTNDFVSYDQVFEDLLVIGSNLKKRNLKALQTALKEKFEAKPYLKAVAAKLGKLEQEKNIPLINEILKVTNKAFAEHITILWENNGDNGLKAKILKANQSSIVRQIKNDWNEAQKSSQVITKDELGELIINQDVIARLRADFTAVSRDSVEAKKKFLLNFFKSIGIPADDKFIDYIETKANNNGFKSFRAKTFAGLFVKSNVIDRILSTYELKPTANLVEGKYNDINNAMIHDRSFNVFVNLFYDLNGDKYQVGNFTGGDGKSIYSYIEPSYLESIKRKLKDPAVFLAQLASRAFSKSSDVVNGLQENIANGVDSFVYEIDYHNSLRKDTDGQIGKVRKRMSGKEMFIEAALSHQNNDKATGYYNIFTLSDKTTTPVIHVTKSKVVPGIDVAFDQSANKSLRDSFDFKDGFKDKLYTLVQGEIDRMLAYAKYTDKEALNIANFETASKLFYFFPVLNNKADADLNAIRNKIYQGIEPDENDQEYIKNIITENFKKSTFVTFVDYVEEGIIKQGTNYKEDDTIEYTYSFPYFDSKYMKNEKIAALSGRHQGILAIADLKFNALRAQINTMQVLGADPALFYKENKSKTKELTKEVFGREMTVNQLINYVSQKKETGEFLNELNTANKIIYDVINTSFDNFSKRSAMFIAPGSQGVTEWTDLKGNVVNIANYRTITLDDFVTNTKLFKDVNVTDAQELVTVMEHINRLMSEGRIPMDIYQSIKDTVEKSKGEHYSLTAKQLSFVMQPTKPVHSSNSQIDEFTTINYVKSSTYPLIPDVLQGSELDKLRKLMENNDIQSANFISAKKVGSPVSVLNLFDKNERFVEPTSDALFRSTQTLDRDGMRTQQEIPHQKTEINNVSQMDRQLFEGTENIIDFEFDGKLFTSPQFKKLKEDIRIALFQKNKEKLMVRFGITEVNGQLIIKDQRALATLLRKEAEARNMSINDIKGIQVDSNGKLIIPLYLMGKSKRFEGLLTSLFSKLVKQKINGTSLVQISGIGTKLEESALEQGIINDIIYTTSYDPTKGLQYLRKEKVGKKTVVKPAQVFISQYIRDEDGSLIDIMKFATRGEDGRLILDPTKVPESVLQLVGARIPNQLHASMIPIEVAGFLPSYMENSIIVPNGITAQMGSDFDVDKLYAYLSEHAFDYSDESKQKMADLTEQIRSIKEAYSVQIDALAEPLLPKELLKQVKALKDTRSKYIAKLGYTEISDKERERRQEVVDDINDQLADIYEELSNKGTEAFKAMKREQILLRSKRDAEMAVLKEERKALRKEALTGLAEYPYSTTKYNNTHQSLADMSEAELIEMYKNLHWSVLTHPEVFNKITTSIDFDDIKSESKLFEDNGLLPFDPEQLPMDFATQIKTYEDNKAGKIGTGIFAQMLSFLSEHQDKNLRINTPIIFQKDDGSIIELSNITKAAKTKATGKERTKTNNTSMMLTESVDNVNNKNLYKFNFTAKTMNALKAMLALSSEGNENLDMRYATRFFPQQIIKDYIKKSESARDSFSESFMKDSEIKKGILNKYISYMSSEQQQRTKQRLEDPKPAYTAFNPEKLLDLLKYQAGSVRLMKQIDLKREVNPEDQKILDRYLDLQIDVLNLYSELSLIGNGLSTIMSATNLLSSGIGSNFFLVADKIRNMEKLVPGSPLTNMFDGIETIIGEISYTPGVGVYVANPIGQAGHAVDVSLVFAKDVISQLSPVQFSSRFDYLRKKILNDRGESMHDKGRDQFIQFSEHLLNSAKSYIFSSQDTGLFSDDITAERKRIFLGGNGQMPLGIRIVDLMNKYPELKENYFLGRLKVSSPTNTKYGHPFTINYSSPARQDIDELANNKGFLQLILSDNKELRDIADDLIKYAYLSGNNNINTSFIHYIPSEVLMLNSTYVNFLKNFEQNAFADRTFHRQFVQHNPKNAKSLNGPQFKALKQKFEKSLTDDALVVLNPKTDSAIMIDALPEEGMGNVKIFPDFISIYKFKVGWVLFEKDEGTGYRRINLLGQDGLSEYSYGVENHNSVYFDNLTGNDKFASIVRSSENPFNNLPVKSKILSFKKEALISNTATTLIGTPISIVKDGKATPLNPDLSTVIDLYGSNVNTGNYTSEDTVFIIGHTLFDFKEDKSTRDITEQERKIGTDEALKIFDANYKPLIDKAVEAGANFAIRGFTGIDSNVRAYLKQKGYTETLGEQKEVYLTAPQPVVADEEGNITAALTETPTEVPTSIEDTFDLSNMDVPVIDDDKFFTPDFVVDDTVEIPNMNNTSSEVVAASNDPMATAAMYVTNVNKLNTLKSVLTKIKANTNNPFYKTVIEMLNKVGMADVKISISNRFDSPGIYNASEKLIIINPELAIDDFPTRTPEQNIEDVIMHEVMHAYTAGIMSRLRENDPTLTQRERYFAVQIKNLFRDTVERVLDNDEHGDGLRFVQYKVGEGMFNGEAITPEQKSLYYGLTNEYEFISMLMTDKGFQQFMNSLPALRDENNETVVTKCKKLLVKLFTTLAESLGMKVESDTVLTEGVNNIFNLLSTTDFATESEKTQLSLFSPAVNNIEDYNLDNQCK